MNKQIKNGRSRIIALTASISFWGVTGFVMAQTAEKNTQNLTHNTEVNITRLTNQTETQSIDSKTAAETSPSSISSESIIQGKPQRYDASLDYYLATGRKTFLGKSEGEKMKNINELNLTGTYTLNDTFGLYLKLNNVLFQKYELYYGYPMQSFSAMIGVNINF